jgi:hypothetical protein
MKKLLLYIGLAFFYIACNDEKKYSNEEADTRDHNMERKTEVGDQGIVTDTTTSTSNNSAYNTDSASGQGNRFDTNNNKGK